MIVTRVLEVWQVGTKWCKQRCVSPLIVELEVWMLKQMIRDRMMLLCFSSYFCCIPPQFKHNSHKNDIKWWWEVGRLLLFGRYGSFSGFHLSLFFIPKLFGETFAETLEETLEADAHSAVPWTDDFLGLSYLLMDIRKPQTKNLPFGSCCFF